MKNHKLVTVDELGRFLVPQEVRDSFDWRPGAPLVATYNLTEGMAMVSEATEATTEETTEADTEEATNGATEATTEEAIGFPCTLDSLGRITLPKATLTALDWKQGTQVAVTPSHNGHSLAVVGVKK